MGVLADEPEPNSTTASPVPIMAAISPLWRSSRAASVRVG